MKLVVPRVGALDAEKSKLLRPARFLWYRECEELLFTVQSLI